MTFFQGQNARIVEITALLRYIRTMMHNKVMDMKRSMLFALLSLVYGSLLAVSCAQIKPNGTIHGSEVDASNTGVPAGHYLKDMSVPITITESWISSSNGGKRVIENLRFLSGAKLTVSADDFTVRYCEFIGAGGVWITRGRKGIVIQDSEFDGKNESTGGECAITYGGVSMIRLDIHHWPRALYSCDGDVSVENCYLHDLTRGPNPARDHIEDIYVAGGANQSFIGNKMISNEIAAGGTGGVSASLAIYNEDYEPLPSLSGIKVVDNYFESEGGFALLCGAYSGKHGAYPTNMEVSGNVFGRGLQRSCGIYGPVWAFNKGGSGNTWTGNVWGTRGPFWVAGDPEEGSAIAAPSPADW
jgi:hypothetical protein